MKVFIELKAMNHFQLDELISVLIRNGVKINDNHIYSYLSYDQILYGIKFSINTEVI